MSPTEPTDAELLVELKRVRSDVGFRNWISLRVRLVIALVVFDLFVSLLSIGAVAIALNAQHDACIRDDTLRAAYTAQWQPLLDSAIKSGTTDTDQAQRFQVGLAGFKQHGCTEPNLVAVGMGITVGVALITIAWVVIRWLVVRRRGITRRV